MKKKISKILSVGLALAVLASLLVVAAPASAGTLSWSKETIPSTTNKVMEAQLINDIAVSPDGQTIYAVLAGNLTYKSTDAGVTWSALTTPTGAINMNKVAIAADSNDIIAIADGTTNKVFLSVNGGSTFSSLGVPSNVAGTAPMGAIYDVAISRVTSGTRYIAAVGTDNASSAVAAVCYFNYGATLPDWRDANDSTDWTDNLDNSATSARAIAFSPNFPSDRVMMVVTGNATHAYFQVASLSSKKWNDISGYSGLPKALDDATSIANASIAVDPAYLGADEATRRVYIGLETAGGTDVPGGIYRLTNTTLKDMKVGTGYAVKSIAINAAGDKIVAGDAAANKVWRCANPTATTPSVYSTTTNKRPGNDTSTTDVVVAWSGDNVVAATTGGTDGGFAVSRDDGKTFNDISLINGLTTTMNIQDIAVTADGSKVYFLADDGTSMSLFRKASAWERVFAWDPASSTTNWVIRTAPENFDVVYLADLTNDVIYYSSDAGQTKMTLRYTNSNMSDIVVESADIVYISTGSSVSKSTNAGFIWGSNKNTNLGGNVYTIKSVGEGQLVASGVNGYVSYSTDSGATFTKITKQVDSDFTNVNVAATGLADGDFIYAASNGIAADNVYRWKMGTSTSWSDIISGSQTANVTGLEIMDDVLFATIYDSTAGASYASRVLSASSATSSSVWSSKSASSTTNGAPVFNRTTKALKVASGPKLWAVDSSIALNRIFSFSDAVTTTSIAVAGPADDMILGVNRATGTADDVIFTWPRLSKATAYDLEIALDEGFTQKVRSETGIATSPSSAATVVFILGPNAAISSGTNSILNYMLGTTYYWRARSSTPVYSPWSTPRSFKVDQAVNFELTVPTAGASNVPAQPTFVWSPVQGAINYELMVAEDSTFAILDFSRSITGTIYKSEETLKHDTTYYWKVRGVFEPETLVGRTVVPGAGTDWVMGVFTTAAAPVEDTPVVIIEKEPAPPAEVKVIEVPVPQPQAIPSYLLWMIIGIGAILIIALIVLIVRTRRVA